MNILKWKQYYDKYERREHLTLEKRIQKIEKIVFMNINVLKFPNLENCLDIYY